MTLVVAWREKDELHLLSDSRLTLASEHQTVDIGAKVLAVPLAIDSAIDASSGESAVLHRGVLGLAFAGSSLNAHLFKEFLIDLLGRLQTNSETAPDFDDLCEALRGIAQRISAELCFFMNAKGLVEFVVVGRCPQSSTLSAARFTVAPSAEGLSCSVQRVLDAPSTFLTLGCQCGRELFETNMNEHSINLPNIYQVFDDLVKSGKCPTVGGDLQYGVSRGDTFTTYGFAREVLVGGDLEIQYRVRGIDMNSEMQRLHELGMHPRYRFIQAPGISDNVIDRELKRYIFNLS